MSAVVARGRVMFAAVGLAAVLGAARPASGALSIDLVERERGTYRVWVTALDDRGRPLPEMASRLSVWLDDQPASRLEVVPARTLHPGLDLELLVDAALLDAGLGQGVRDALAEAGTTLEDGDRVRVTVLGRRDRGAERPVARIAELPGLLAELRTEGTPRLYDALFAAVQRIAQRSQAWMGTVLLVTAGRDDGSRHRSVDVLALARHGRLTPLHVVMVESAEGPPGGGLLARLAEETGGSLTVADTPDALPEAVRAVVGRQAGRVVARFEAPSGGTGAARHVLRVRAVGDSATWTAASEFADGEVAAPASWTAFGALAAIGVASALLALLLLRPRRRCLLVVEEGFQRGCWFEVFDLPVTVGAGPTNDIVLPDPRVSRNHLMLVRRGRGIAVSDLNSENGTALNGERVTHELLRDGDRLSLGEAVTLVFEAPR